MADFLAFSRKVEAYWEATPWSAVYGQLGCTLVTEPQIDYHATSGSWGAAGADLSVVVQCPDVTSGLAAVRHSAVQTKGDLLASAPSSEAVTPNISAPYTNMNCAESGSHNAVCVGMPFTGYLTGSEQNLNSGTETGHVHLGRVGYGGNCGAGTLVKNGPTTTTGYEEYVILNDTVSQDSKWVSQWYDPGETAQVCGTY